ncbi:hypothetical protein AX15_002889 [Amanita polypyramis BW_CC]|nr:hypothetical protein AX15_002889 [Amanita polypyramis BW_CC]
MDTPASAPAKATFEQPQAAMQMSVVNTPLAKNQQTECQNKKASRIRGGGAGKDCFLGLNAARVVANVLQTLFVALVSCAAEGSYKDCCVLCECTWIMLDYQEHSSDVRTFILHVSYPETSPEVGNQTCFIRDVRSLPGNG